MVDDQRKGVLDRRTDLDDADTRPNYYGGPDAPFEPVKVIDDVGLGPGFYYGSALKYIQRAPHKGTKQSDLKKAEWYLTNGVKLGYKMPHQGFMKPDEVTAAWDLPDELDIVVRLVLVGDVQAASENLQEYLAAQKTRPETAPMPFAKG